MKKSSWALLIGIMFFISCDNNNKKIELSGTVTIHDNTTGALASVALYNPAVIQAELQQISTSSPNVGAETSQYAFFDHRTVAPVNSKSCASNGAFNFADLSEGSYILAAYAEGYGWVYSDVLYLNDKNNLGELHLYPETLVSVSIDQNTVWESKKHHLIDSQVEVAQNVLLTIENGAWIRFQNSTARLKIAGEIQAIGIYNSWIRFTSEYQGNSPGIWSKISLNNDSDNSSTFMFSLIEHASTGISINNQKTIISNSIVRDCDSGLSILSNDPSQISYSTIYNTYIGVDCGGNAEVTNSLIYNSTQIGYTLSNYTTSMSNSIITECGIGFSENYADFVSISHSNINSNNIGLRFIAGAQLSMSVDYCNVRDNNDRGLHCSTDAYPLLSYCNIINYTDSTAYNVYCAGQQSGSQYLQGDDIDALNCYWGTTDNELISNSFHDGISSGNAQLGNVLFEPFALQEIMEAGP